jgi:hypothetical protein
MAMSQVAAKRRFRWSTVVIFAIAGALVWGVWAFARLTDVPEDQAAAEAQLERPLLFYDVWDGTPYIVVEVNGVVHFDHLILDMNAIIWPRPPRWQWSGMWDSLEASTAPASAGFARTDDDLVLFGQINDASISRIEILNDYGVAFDWQGSAVHGGGYAVRLGSVKGKPVWINFLDEAGHVVYSVSYLNE